ncbi:MAG: hypothetical protein WC480_02430 [Patescibacteria group bacterium]
MTRLDDNQSLASAPADIQQAIKEEAQKLRPEKTVIKKRSLFSCGNCVLFLLVLLLLFSSLAGYTLARTGLFQIPIFSALFYQTPAPSHLVTATPSDLESFNNKLGQSVILGAKEIDLSLTEAELTAVVQNGFLESDSESLVVSYVQVAVADSGIEFFVQLEKPLRGFLTVNIVPLLDDEKKIKVNQLKIGNLVIPRFIGESYVQKMLASELSKLSGVPLELKGISLEPGIIKLNLVPKSAK